MKKLNALILLSLVVFCSVPLFAEGQTEEQFIGAYISASPFRLLRPQAQYFYYEDEGGETVDLDLALTEDATNSFGGYLKYTYDYYLLGEAGGFLGIGLEGMADVGFQLGSGEVMGAELQIGGGAVLSVAKLVRASLVGWVGIAGSTFNMGTAPDEMLVGEDLYTILADTPINAFGYAVGYGATLTGKVVLGDFSLFAAASFKQYTSIEEWTVKAKVDEDVDGNGSQDDYVELGAFPEGTQLPIVDFGSLGQGGQIPLEFQVGVELRL